MIRTLFRAMSQPGGNVLQDMIGALCLVVILLGALHLPSL